MREITIKISDEVLSELESKKEEELLEIFFEGLRKVKVRKALEMYQQGDISFGRASELAGIREDDLSREAYSRGIEPPYSDEMIGEELE